MTNRTRKILITIALLILLLILIWGGGELGHRIGFWLGSN